jgi:S1-C subfamily serine protease
MLGVLCAVAACAAPAPQVAGGSQEIIDALTRAHAAVVGVDVTAAEGARSADTLGHERNGSGVVIGPDGLILTIGYLMLEADTIEIQTQDGHTFPAKAVAYDGATGFGLIKPLLPLPGVRAVPLGTLQNLPTGERMVVVTGGDDGEIVITQLLSKRAFSGYWEYHIDAAIFTSPPVTNHSGAGLFNERGELVGIGSLFVADALGAPPRVAGNMFVPVDLLRPILAELQKTGSTRQSRRPWLGVTSSEQGGRVQVMRVAEGGPAQLGGVESGDIILAVDEQRVASLDEFYKSLWSHPNPDDEIKLTLLHGAELKVVKLKGVDRMTTMVKPAGI